MDAVAEAVQRGKRGQRMKIGDRVFIHGYVDEIRKETVIIRNKGGYFGTDKSEVIVSAKDMEPVTRCKDCRWYSVKGKTTMYGWCDANWISVNETDYCSKGERQRNYFGERKEP